MHDFTKNNRDSINILPNSKRESTHEDKRRTLSTKKTGTFLPVPSKNSLMFAEEIIIENG